MMKEIGAGAAPVTSSVTVSAPTATVVTQPRAASGSSRGEEARRVVLKLLAAKTGFDEEMVEPDMELETELGIDSIKRVEILSEVQAELGVEAKDVAAPSRTRTVGEVIDAMMKEIGAGAAPVTSSV